MSYFDRFDVCLAWYWYGKYDAPSYEAGAIWIRLQDLEFEPGLGQESPRRADPEEHENALAIYAELQEKRR